jgi:hypothetical protein
VVKDAAADYSEEMMYAAIEVNLPNYATAIMTTQEMVQFVTSLTPSEIGVQQ